jgi:hypothetical protein
VDDTSLINGRRPAEPDPVAGAGPVVAQAVRSVLEQHIASVTRKALDRRAPGLLDTDAFERLAVQAAERQLAELADPPGLYYLTLEEWVAEWLFPVYRRSVLGHDGVWCAQWWRHAEAVARLVVATCSGPGVDGRIQAVIATVVVRSPRSGSQSLTVCGVGR